MFTATQVALISAARDAALSAAVHAAAVASHYDTIFRVDSLVAVYKERHGTDFCAEQFELMVQCHLEQMKEDRKNAYNYDDGGEWEAARLRESQESEGLVMSELIDMPYEHWAESRGF